MASSLPIGNSPGVLRPVNEIAGRHVALAWLFVHVAMPEEAFPTRTMREFASAARIEDHLTPDELAVAALSRVEAREEHVNTIGWRSENCIALAWVLGGPDEPGVDGAMLEHELIRRIVTSPDPREPGSLERWRANLRPRSLDVVVEMEDRFYCCHNAVRSAQIEVMRAQTRPTKRLKTVPREFDPLSHGGVIHERRHALTWSLSPGVAWNDTDLST